MSIKGSSAWTFTIISTSRLNDASATRSDPQACFSTVSITSTPIDKILFFIELLSVATKTFSKREVSSTEVYVFSITDWTPIVSNNLPGKC